MNANTEEPGLIALLGSGETAAVGGMVYDMLALRLPAQPRIALLETPAGFQTNSARVAGKAADFIQKRLQHLRPQLSIVPARRRGTPQSPDDTQIAQPVTQAHVVFLGPGSPTYAVRQLTNTYTWHATVARHRRGASIVLASAAVLAMGKLTLPVYEIYKVGDDLHWQAGLDLLAPFGLSLAIVPHWNNTEGGAELDTRRCFMGVERWEQLQAMVPADVTIVGIDEHTALILDLAAETCRVLGRGEVAVLRAGVAQPFAPGQAFAMQVLGPFRRPAPDEGIPPDVWRATGLPTNAPEDTPLAEVRDLVTQRQAARAARDWALSDRLRAQIATLGWEVRDTAAEPVLARLTLASD
ncbi:MAG: cysteinyl-tRNA synthetase [Chloroflexales bacterium]|nr:cysteinyl-tRNA synthetase [Chloroflexales bacterium]